MWLCNSSALDVAGVDSVAGRVSPVDGSAKDASLLVAHPLHLRFGLGRRAGRHALREEDSLRPRICPWPDRRLARHWGHGLLDRRRHWIECVDLPEQLERRPAPGGHGSHLQLSDGGNRANHPRDAGCELNVRGEGGTRHCPGDPGRFVPRPRL
eukprot:scaffold80378_cov72-Phaeocystis_antarctica.AAC.2